MSDNATISNMGSNADVRTFFMTVDIPEPQEGQVLNICLDAPWPFEIVEVHHVTITGQLEAELLNNGVTVELTDDTVDGYIEATSTPSEHFPASTSAPNYTVAGTASFQVVLHNVSTDCLDYSIQIDCRRTQVNA